MVHGDPHPLKSNTEGESMMVVKARKCSNINHHWGWWESETANTEKGVSPGQEKSSFCSQNMYLAMDESFLLDRAADEAYNLKSLATKKKLTLLQAPL